MIAALDGHLEIARLLMNSNADITKKNKDGQTAFDLANDEIKGIIKNFIAQNKIS